MEKLRSYQNRDGVLTFFCPGCQEEHTVWTKIMNENPNGAVWSFNGNMEKPTFSPSILIRWTKTFNGVVDFVCHSFVKDGMIQFLADCTHSLAGKTVELPNIDN